MIAIAAGLFALFAALLAVFQIGLALGAPWGHLAMGGRWPGRLPGYLRVNAVVQAGLTGVFAWVVLARAGLVVQHGVPGWAIWVVLVFSILGAVMNLITPARAERLLWGPVALIMLASLVRVMFG